MRPTASTNVPSTRSTLSRPKHAQSALGNESISGSRRSDRSGSTSLRLRDGHDNAHTVRRLGLGRVLTNGLQSGRTAYPERACDLLYAHSGIPEVSGRLTLLGIECWGSSTEPAPRPSGSQPISGPLSQGLDLPGRQYPQQAEEHPRCRGIRGDCRLRRTLEDDVPRSHFFYGLVKVPAVSAPSTDGIAVDGVPCLRIREQFTLTRAVSTCATASLRNDVGLRDAQLAGAVQLKVKALLPTRLRGGNASVKPCLRGPNDLRVVHQC